MTRFDFALMGLLALMLAAPLMPFCWWAISALPVTVALLYVLAALVLVVNVLWAVHLHPRPRPKSHWLRIASFCAGILFAVGLLVLVGESLAGFR